MMMSLFNIAAERDAQIKEAIAGPVLGAAMAIGKKIVTNPLAAAGGILTGLEYSGAAAKASGDVARSRSGAGMAAGQVLGGGTF